MRRWMRVVAMVVLLSWAMASPDGARASDFPPGGHCQDVNLEVASVFDDGSVLTARDGPGAQWVVNRHFFVSVRVTDWLEGRPVVFRSIGSRLRVGREPWDPYSPVSGQAVVTAFANGGVEVRWPAGTRGRQFVFLTIPEDFPKATLRAMSVNARVVGGRCTASMRLRFGPLEDIIGR